MHWNIVRSYAISVKLSPSRSNAIVKAETETLLLLFFHIQNTYLEFLDFVEIFFSHGLDDVLVELGEKSLRLLLVHLDQSPPGRHRCNLESLEK